MKSNDNFNFIENLVKRYPELSVCRPKIEKAVAAILDVYSSGGKILLCGNGGSAADCEHIAGELLKGFITKRTPESHELMGLTLALGSENCAKKLQRGIPAIPLPSITGAVSAFANDVDPELVYAQLVFSLGKSSDLLVCLSTSGNSKNIVNAARVAKALGIKTLALTGESGGELKKICDITITAPECETYKIQEYHLPIYHAICAEAERILF